MSDANDLLAAFDAFRKEQAETLAALRREVAEVREKLAYKEQVFTGWKQIADYIGYSEDHCKELGQDEVHPIPHWHEGGGVVAARSMLDLWKFNRRKPAQKRAARQDAIVCEKKPQLDMFRGQDAPKRGRATDGSAS